MLSPKMTNNKGRLVRSWSHQVYGDRHSLFVSLPSSFCLYHPVSIMESTGCSGLGARISWIWVYISGLYVIATWYWGNYLYQSESWRKIDGLLNWVIWGNFAIYKGVFSVREKQSNIGYYCMSGLVSMGSCYYPYNWRERGGGGYQNRERKGW